VQRGFLSQCYSLQLELKKRDEVIAKLRGRIHDLETEGPRRGGGDGAAADSDTAVDAETAATRQRAAQAWRRRRLMTVVPRRRDPLDAVLYSPTRSPPPDVDDDDEDDEDDDEMEDVSTASQAAQRIYNGASGSVVIDIHSSGSSRSSASEDDGGGGKLLLVLCHLSSLSKMTLPTSAQRSRSETKQNILEDLLSSVLIQFKIYYPSGNLKFNNSGIFQSLKFRILMGKIILISLKLNFTPNTLGCYDLDCFELWNIRARGRPPFI